MSNLTNWGENRVADYHRGQGSAFLPASWYVGLASAADDGSITELSGTGYARVGVVRALANWSGTQALGSTLASTGTSHLTANNNPIDFGTSGAAWGTANFAVLYDASSGGNAFLYAPLDTPIVIGMSDPVSIAAQTLQITWGLTGGMTDYLANKEIDLFFRAQAYAYPANTYAALFTAAPSNAGGGTEVNTGSYARVAIASSAAAWDSTQGDNSTTSTGTGGEISNSATITWPSSGSPNVGWGGLYDAASSGNLLFWRAANAAKTLNPATPPYVPANSWTITFA